MSTDDGLRVRIEKELVSFLTARREQLIGIDESLGPVADALESFVLRGGKRLRPAFAYWAYRGSSGVDRPEVVTALASFELLHAGALIHDDVVDASDTRRGEPAVHRAFATRHAAAGWTGSPEQFGRSAAILLGDLCLVWSDEMFRSAGLEPGQLRAAQPYYDAMRTEVMAGQYLDVLTQARGDESTAHAGKVAQYKSGKYTVERPLLVGAALAGGTPGQLAGFSRFGLPLGEAFQLRDDVLGVYGDPSQTGKPAGGDLREGKRTFLVAAAIEAGDAQQRATLRRLLGDPQLDDAGVAEMQAVIDVTGALARTENRIAALTSEALAALDSLDLVPEAAAALRELTGAAVQRAT